METKTGKLITCESMHYTKTDVDWLYVQRIHGGRGLTQLEIKYKIGTMGLNAYLESTNDCLLKFVY